MRNKAIILDLDGTVVDSPKQKLPSVQLVDVIDKLQKDFYVCAATGRVWTFAKPVLKALKLNDPCIISAGTQICDPLTEKIIWQRVLPDNSVEKVIKILKQYPEYKLLYNDISEDDYFYGGVYPKDFNQKKPVFLLNFVFVPNSIAKKISVQLNKIDGIVCILAVAQKPGCNDLHITDNKATKENSIAKLLRILQVNRENTIGIGDGNNDIHLFNAVGYKIAMGNAVDELKENADRVIGNVQKDGLVNYLTELLISSKSH